MFTYAYLIGKAVKIGVDQGDLAARKRLTDHRSTALAGAAIYGLEPAQDVVLWERQASCARDAYAIEKVLKRRFQDKAVCGKEWLAAADEVIAFFKGLTENPDWTNEWCARIIKQAYPPVTE